MAAGIAGGLALTACSQTKPEPSGSARMAAAVDAAEAPGRTAAGPSPPP